MRLVGLVLFAMTLGSLGCAAGAQPDASQDEGSGGSGGSEGSGSTTVVGVGGGSSTSSSSGSWSVTATVGSGAAPPAGATVSSGTGTMPPDPETTCDGIDNDGNGIVDDVDKGLDGICDCIRIATLGEKGEWGTGDVFAQWLSSRSDFGAVPLDVTAVTQTVLDQYHVIVAQDLAGDWFLDTIPASSVTAVQGWVQAGGGLMTLAGYNDDWSITNVNTLLAPFGLSYGSSEVLHVSGGTAAVSSWVTDPVTQGVSLIGISNGYPVQGGTPLAYGGGYTVLQVSTIGSGRVLNWSDEWITYDTEWTAHPEYQVELFWQNIIKWLTPPDFCQVPTRDPS